MMENKTEKPVEAQNEWSLCPRCGTPWAYHDVSKDDENNEVLLIHPIHV